MNNASSAPEPADRSVTLAPNAWTRFWFTPIPTTGLKCLRVLCGLLFFFWLFSFAGHQVEIFSLNGWLDTDTLSELRRQQEEIRREQAARGQKSIPQDPVGWSILYIAPDNVEVFQAMYWGSLAVLLLFTLGVATRITGVLTWVIVVSFYANPITRYDGDFLLGILAFYMMIGHLVVGQWTGNLSIVERLFGRRDDFLFSFWLWPRQDEATPDSHGANLVLRMLQIHVIIVMLTSVLHKLQIADWWSGVALWYPLHPTFQTSLESLQREAPNTDFTLLYLSIATYLVLAWQLAFPVIAWRTGWWRYVLLGGAAIGWLGAFFVYRLPLFGPFVVIGSLSFLRPEEWAWALDRVRFKGAKPESTSALPEPKKVSYGAGKESIRK